MGSDQGSGLDREYQSSLGVAALAALLRRLLLLFLVSAFTFRDIMMRSTTKFRQILKCVDEACGTLVVPPDW